MFSRKDQSFFLAALLLAAFAYTLMVVDPIEYGFGILTLWIAPPLLLAAFCLPVIGIIGGVINYKECWLEIKKNPAKQVGGVGVFVVALAIYLITLEPTASLWDCSEFIASAHKLQVPHSPGVPLFLLIGRLFSMLVLDDVTRVAPAMNSMSALFSALTVFITYHLIYRLAVCMDGAEKVPSVVPVCAALCGSLCVAFSDSFWFSAVEAETYGAAVFFLMLLVWLIVSGKDLPRETRTRRLVLIFYVAGLSFCIHPMCLLALPLLPICWYGEKITSMKKFLLAVGVGLLIVIVINRLVAVGLFELMFSFDLFFVNSFHAPFYSGAIALLVLMTLLFIFLLRRFRTHSQYIWATIFLLAGFLPYILLFIRSNHNPPIDETNPEDLALIRAYMNRDSYGSTPLLYGPYFDAEIEGVTVKNKMYYKHRDSYQIAGTTSAYQYNKSRQTILPRMYSNDENHITAYRQWTGLKENEQPDFSDNLEFMVRVQLGEMYFRYFLFNFAGRESDVQYSAWLKPWDSTKGDKSRNQYWMLPLLLGLAGAGYHSYKNKQDFLTIAIFFLVTGALLAIYLNAPPTEPRERDYIYVGSFIAFSIWIGLGIKAIGIVGARYKMGLYVLPFISLFVPAWMGWENFDDHDRSGRTFQIDNAKNLLQSCAPNSVLFTGGDNDTFPLWYLQEVEGFRTDVRVMVLSYLNTDWYINQLRRAYYNSPPFDLSLSETDYLQYGPNDVLYVSESIKEGIDAKKYLQLLHDQHPALKMHSSNGEPYSIIPSRILKVPALSSRVSNQTRLANEANSTNEEIVLNVKGNYLTKNSLALIDLLISNEWKRPVYFNFTSYNQIDLNVAPYLVQQGLVYRLMPRENRSKDVEADTQLMYENLISKASYENLLNDDIYFNYEDFQARMVEPLRAAFNELAVGLLNEGDEVKARTVLDRALSTLYVSHLKPSYSNLQTAEILLSLGETSQAVKLSAAVFDSSFPVVEESLTKGEGVEQLPLFLLQRSSDLLSRADRSEYASKLEGLKLLR